MTLFVFRLLAFFNLILSQGIAMNNAEEKTEAPYGSWSSPLSAEQLTSKAVRLLEGEPMGESIVFAEARPEEGGRTVLVEMKEGQFKDLIPTEYNVRTLVHEYGGKSHMIVGDVIYFSNFKDQQLYKRGADGAISQLTHDSNRRFADGCPFKDQLIYVMEEHGDAVENSLAIINMKGDVKQIAKGWDFYRSPRVSPDQKKLAYYRWNHPNMPWDGGELIVADIAPDGSLSNELVIAGGPEESIAQHAWGPDGKLYYTSDRSNWWNLYSEGKNLAPMEAEIGFPQWVFGQTYFDFWNDENIVCVISQNGSDTLALIHKGAVEKFQLPYRTIKNLKVKGDFCYFIGSSPKIPSCLVKYNLKTNDWDVLKKSRDLNLSVQNISEPRAIEFPTDGGKTAHAFYYPPQNMRYRGPKGEKPPLLVLSHGGPTANVEPRFDLAIQYWTTRGIAVVDVNYGGSSGYGREYRNRLNHNWGIVDVADCTNAALYCAEQGLADRDRLCIAGGSAGGYTTLACLAFTDVFKAGACFYGVSDLEALAKDTHKFESRYLDHLVGPYPEEKQLYVDRSPIHHVENIRCPIIILQGDEDKIVPPSQSELMYESLLQRGIPTAYLLFEKEQHGFRQAKNITRAIESEAYFFSKIFGFQLADKVEPVEIANLKVSQ